MGRTLVLYNPAARSSPDPALLRRILQRLAWKGLSAEAAASAHPGELTALARGAADDGVERLVVCGGDGSIREVAEGCAGTGIPLAIVPLGTANILAAELGLPREPMACAEVAAAGRPRTVALGFAGGRAFTFAASAGFDSAAVDRVDLKMKRQTGAWAYAYAGLVSLLEGPLPAITVETDDGRRAVGHQVVAARASRYGLGFLRLSGRARLEDSGTVFLVFHGGPATWPRMIASLFKDGVEGCPGVAVLAATAARLTAGAPVPIQADGDPMGLLPSAIETRPGALTLVVPR